jgi:hypothetical protein
MVRKWLEKSFSRASGGELRDFLLSMLHLRLPMMPDCHPLAEVQKKMRGCIAHTLIPI